ncbi:MAG: hypothetical protein KME03_20740 [Aphanocapsa lilacina HA4352-LM1]|nr:hypothetical protein [Aphanocapsa lilacina HA4352-LM1]
MQGFWGKVVLVAGTVWILGWQAAAAWSATGYLLVPKTQEVRRVDLESGKLVRSLNLPVGNVYHNAARTSDGQLLVAGDEAVSLIDAEGRLVEQIPLPAPVVSASYQKSPSDLPVLQASEAQTRRLVGLDYSPRTRTAYLGIKSEEVTTLYRVDPAARTVQVFATLKDIANPKDLVVTADGLRVYVSAVDLLPEPAARVYSVNPVTGAVSAPLEAAFDPARPQMALSRDGNLLYLTAADDSLIVVNTRSNTAVRRLRITGASKKEARIQRVLGALDNRHLWVLTNRRMLLWDPLNARAVLDKALPVAAMDVAMSADKGRLWSLHPPGGEGKPAEVRAWDSTKDSLPAAGSFSDAISGGNRLLLAEPPDPAAALSLPRVAVVGFETGQPRYGRYPNVADVISGDLLWTRRYEIVPPLQVQSVLDSLELSRNQVMGNPDAIRQVATLLGADIILAGEPIGVAMPNRSLEALSSLISPIAAFLVPQFFQPKVFSRAEAFDATGKSLWKGDVVNSDSAFFAGKTDTVLLANALVITAHDIANKFSKGIYNEIKQKGWRTDLPPLLKNDALKDVKRVALLGPEVGPNSSLFNEVTNTPESLGQLIAPRLGDALGWEVEGPDEALSQLAQLGLEPAQILTTDPKLLARALGVDAVMLGLVRSSTYISGGFVGLSQNAAADVVLQFELVDQQGRVLWKDIQVRNIAVGDAEGGALRQAAKAIVERLEQGIEQAEGSANNQRS